MKQHARIHGELDDRGVFVEEPRQVEVFEGAGSAMQAIHQRLWRELDQTFGSHGHRRHAVPGAPTKVEVQRGQEDRAKREQEPDLTAGALVQPDVLGALQNPLRQHLPLLHLLEARSESSGGEGQGHRLHDLPIRHAHERDHRAVELAVLRLMMRNSAPIAVPTRAGAIVPIRHSNHDKQVAVLWRGDDGGVVDAESMRHPFTEEAGTILRPPCSGSRSGHGRRVVGARLRGTEPVRVRRRRCRGAERVQVERQRCRALEYRDGLVRK
mmetsp:Transcript_176573/g.566134  ORF Transcript_176573/g.566134 Transcript_176573/m.566134 type:complete len:268 (-) Transcript_176573:245-1048(-)